jgi:hypothetical protein
MQIIKLTGAAVLFCMIVLMGACTSDSEGSSEQVKSNQEAKKRELPGTGHELVDFILDKTAARVSLLEEDRVLVKRILEETFESKYGDLSQELDPDSVNAIRKSVFFGSRDSLRKYIKLEKRTE